MTTTDETASARNGALGRGIESLIDNETTRTQIASTDASVETISRCAAKLIGAAAAGTVAVAACTLLGVRAVLAMRGRL